MLRNLFIVMFALIFAIAMIGCEGEEGPQGPAGPAGPQGEQGPQGEPGEDAPEAPDYTYLGTNGEACQHCHNRIVSTWEETAHPQAYAILDEEDQENPYCLKCHVTGVEDEVIDAISFGDTEFPEGDNPHGYDDYFGVDTEEAAMRREALQGVQCEACHGPLGPETGFGGHAAEIDFGTVMEDDGSFESTCNPCHHTQLEEWSGSGHANAADGDIDAFQEEHYAHRSSCDVCHTSEGFVRNNDPAFADYAFDGTVNFVGCVTCHDPHDAENPYQLRVLEPQLIQYAPGGDEGEDAPEITGLNNGQLCVQCHHARRDTENVQGQIADGYGHFGPHSSPQGDMFWGYGSYEIDGYTYDREMSHKSALETSEDYEACVTCHMTREAEIHGEMTVHSFHEMEIVGDNCTDVAGCHTADPSGAQANLTAEIEGKLNQIATWLGYADYHAMEATLDDDNLEWTPEQREVAYAAVFVISDGSMGVHNPAYANSLLDNAIDYMSILP